MSVTRGHPRAGAQGRERLHAAVRDGSLAALAAAHGLALVVLFGSAADPDVDEPGDLDLAVAWSSGAPGDLLRLTSDLTGLLGDAVDVLDLDRAGPVARQRALTRGEVLLELEQGALATRQMRAVRDHMDTAWMRRLQLDLLAEGSGR